MKKFILTASTLIVTSLLLVGCEMPGGKTPTPAPTQEDLQDVKQVNQNGMKNSLASLLQMGKKQKCTWRVEAENGVNSGTVYIDGKRYKSEVSMSGEENLTMYSYSDGEWNYVWGGLQFGENKGIKMRINAMEEEMDQVETQENYRDMEQYQSMQNNDVEYDYQCENWRVDESVFTLPANVNFVDPTESLKRMQEQAEQMQGNLEQMQEEMKRMGIQGE